MATNRKPIVKLTRNPLPPRDAPPIVKSPRAQPPACAAPSPREYDLPETSVNLCALPWGTCKHASHLHLKPPAQGAARRILEKENKPPGPRKYVVCYLGPLECTNTHHFHPLHALVLHQATDAQNEEERVQGNQDALAELEADDGWDAEHPTLPTDSFGNDIVPVLAPSVPAPTIVKVAKAQVAAPRPAQSTTNICPSRERLVPVKTATKPGSPTPPNATDVPAVKVAQPLPTLQERSDNLHPARTVCVETASRTAADAGIPIPPNVTDVPAAEAAQSPPSLQERSDKLHPARAVCAGVPKQRPTLAADQVETLRAETASAAVVVKPPVRMSGDEVKFDQLTARLICSHGTAKDLQGMHNIQSRMGTALTQVSLPLTTANLERALTIYQKVSKRDALVGPTPTAVFDNTYDRVEARATNDNEICEAVSYANMSWFQWRVWRKPAALLRNSLRHVCQDVVRSTFSSQLPYDVTFQQYRRDICNKRNLPDGDMSPRMLINDTEGLGDRQDTRDRPFAAAALGIRERITSLGDYVCKPTCYPVGFSTDPDAINIYRKCCHNMAEAIRKRQLLPAKSTPEVMTEAYAGGFSALKFMLPGFEYEVRGTPDALFEAYVTRHPLSRQKPLREAYRRMRAGEESTDVVAPFVKVENGINKPLEEAETGVPRNISSFRDLLRSVEVAGPILSFQKQFTAYLKEKYAAGQSSGTGFLYTSGMDGKEIGKLVSTFEAIRAYAGESDSSKSDAHSTKEAIRAQNHFYAACGMDFETMCALGKGLSYRGCSSTGIRYTAANEKSGKQDTSVGTTLRHLAATALTAVITAILTFWGEDLPSGDGFHGCDLPYVGLAETDPLYAKDMPTDHECKLPYDAYPKTPEGAFQLFIDHKSQWLGFFANAQCLEYQLNTQLGDDSKFLGRALDIEVHQFVGRMLGMVFEDVNHGNDRDAYDSLSYCSSFFVDVGPQRVMCPKIFRTLAKTFMPHDTALPRRLVPNYLKGVALGLRHLEFLPVLGPILRQLQTIGGAPRLEVRGPADWAHKKSFDVHIEPEAVSAWFERKYGHPVEYFDYLAHIDFRVPGRLYRDLPGFREAGVVDGLNSLVELSAPSESWNERFDAILV